MTADTTALPSSPWNVALVGNPNCGKTALFNLLTGARQKVANYAGVTVERKIGLLRLPSGRSVSIIDLPGVYSLHPATPDEEVTLEVIEGRRAGEAAIDAIVAVVDATNLRMNLRLVLELMRLGHPVIVALNMTDVARARGLAIDVAKLSDELACPVVETVAIQHNGHSRLLAQLDHELARPLARVAAAVRHTPRNSTEIQHEVRRILAIAAPQAGKFQRFHFRVDAWAMHPVWGLVILAAILFLVFQAVFSWANMPMDAIKSAMAFLAEWTSAHMDAGPLRSLLVDGVIAGAGGVLVFLPQILILFFFILVLEDSGYLPRAAFLLDTLMGKVGLSGRAFIPLLSSFACAVPGIMATRTIANWQDRLATIMVAPLMTCSARLPVYALLIGAFVPDRTIGIFNLRGLTLFVLYVAGVLSAMGVAWVFKRIWMKSRYQPLMLELPPYRLPSLRNLTLGLWERARIFVRRVGTIIFALMVVLWFLSTYPGPPDGATGPAIQYSLAGMMGHALEPLFAPIGFNWQISVALVPGLAAREVAVGALGTVYSLSAAGDAVASELAPVIAKGWSLATAFSLLAWYVFAPQCISTLAVVKRETNSWRYPLLMTAYMFALAYLASFITYRVTLWWGG
ncbi:ferrous iron transporter B [Candidatus Aalborgicola defluviihabitans]|uniref:ferrous iron transporter B n=1 Tax=Candidatus Aalborgicola defluviihabitans TaxID=3386187 RepID=UPI001D37C4FD|nr:ferrous iron transporter B [Burkholderiales bacterium]MBK6570334.1 ferrous iron transporter B [Burkholderiales bacterium]MBK7279337.1 ferrous iron transporter B [Burkholderiales bacterium]MBK7312968.1 ferrous iron transporter B [Burkholderiales bacterium]MBL0243778.1 ferrous iron transporter B [Rhodoferax sp.]